LEHNDLGEQNRKTERIESCDDTVTPPMALTLDIEKYEHFFEDEEMTESQKREYLETLWNIVVSFIQMGVEVRPALETCGKPAVSADCREVISGDVVKLELQNLNNTFKTAMDRASDPEQEGDRNDR